MFKLIISANTLGEMRNRLQDAIAQISMAPVNHLTGGETSGVAAVVEQIANAPEWTKARVGTIETEAAPKKTRTRKAKTETAAILPTTETKVEDTAPAAVIAAPQIPTESTGEKLAPTISKSAATDALVKVNAKLGLVGARDMLQRFGVNRVSDLAPEKYGAFISDCEKSLS